MKQDLPSYIANDAAPLFPDVSAMSDEEFNNYEFEHRLCPPNMSIVYWGALNYYWSEVDNRLHAETIITCA